MLTVLPDARYEVKSFATDGTRNNVSAYGVFHATHTGPGGPLPPTGRSTSTDYVYVMQFEGDTIVPLTKIWNRRPRVEGPQLGLTGSEPSRLRYPYEETAYNWPSLLRSGKSCF